MATKYTDQFWIIDPAAPPGQGAWLKTVEMTFLDRDDDGRISRPGYDRIDGHQVSDVWNGDTITVRMPGLGVVTIKGVTIYAKGMKPVFTPTDGTVLKDAVFLKSTFVTDSTSLDLGDLAPACFTPGTLIETATGPRPVERIAVGERIVTLDDGVQPVTWTGRRRVAARGRFAPVRIARGALGNRRDLTVSPQHRILVQGWAAELHCGQDALLVAARHLVDGGRIRVMPGGMVDYLHLGFARHALILSEGIWTESHFAGAAGRAEGVALFPGRVDMAQLVRPEARSAESRVLAAAVLA
jgi:hypothetical protein